MDTRYLLDANIVIYIRQKRPEAVLRRFSRLRARRGRHFGHRLRRTFVWSDEKLAARVCAGAVTRVEPCAPRPSVLEKAAEAYGAIRAELASKGDNNDVWIAAHALASGLTLVTNNEKGFRRVRGLKIQNWTT